MDDTTSSGGKVLYGSSGIMFRGKAVSCLGDKVLCPVHGMTSIAEVDEASVINGKPVALNGHRCGCVVITSLPNAGRR